MSHPQDPGIFNNRGPDDGALGKAICWIVFISVALWLIMNLSACTTMSQADQARVGAAMQQLGGDMQRISSARQYQAYDAMQHSVDNIQLNPALQYHPVAPPAPIPPPSSFQPWMN